MKKPAKQRPNRKVVSAEEFRLVNKRGKCKAKLCLNGDGGPSLAFLDDRGKLRVSIYLHSDQVGIELLSKKEKVRASLGVASNGQPSLQLLDGDEQVHACLEMGTKGDGQTCMQSRKSPRITLAYGQRTDC